MKDWLLWSKPLLLQVLTLTVLAPNFLWEITPSLPGFLTISDWEETRCTYKVKLSPPQKKGSLYIKAFWHLHSLAEDIHVCILPGVAISDVQETFPLWMLMDFSVGTLYAQKVTGFPLRKKMRVLQCLHTRISRRIPMRTWSSLCHLLI